LSQKQIRGTIHNQAAGLAGPVVLILAAVCIAVIVVLFVPSEDKEEPVKIGAIISLSGAGSNLVDVRDGMTLAVDEVNSRGRINSRKTELIIEDSKTSPEEGVKAFKKIEELHHPLLYVSTLSGVAMAVSELAEQIEVALVGLVEGNPTLTKQVLLVRRN
jgi:ABC-type branched-subunit amino acid transport system substrate-binding protein